MSSRPALVQPCPADGQSVRPVRGVYDPGRLDIRQDETQARGHRSSSLTLASSTAAELLRAHAEPDGGRGAVTAPDLIAWPPMPAGSSARVEDVEPARSTAERHKLRLLLVPEEPAQPAVLLVPVQATGVDVPMAVDDGDRPVRGDVGGEPMVRPAVQDGVRFDPHAHDGAWSGSAEARHWQVVIEVLDTAGLCGPICHPRRATSPQQWRSSSEKGASRANDPRKTCSTLDASRLRKARWPVTATSIDAALSLIAYYTGRGRDVELHALPYGDLERATLQLALLVRRCLGQTDDERHSELGRLSLHLQLRSDLDHPHAVDQTLTLLSSVVATDDDRAAARIVLGLPAEARTRLPAPGVVGVQPAR